MTFTDGAVTTDGTEQTLFDITAEAHFSFYLFTHNMQAGDSVTIRVYVMDSEGSTMRKIETIALQNVQSDPTWFYPFLPATEYKATIQRTSGTDRGYNWQRIEVT